MSDCLLRALRRPSADLTGRQHEVCCLPGAEVQDVAEGVPQPVKSTDYYPLSLFHVGTNDTARRNAGRINEDFKALGVKANSFGAQVVSSSVLLVEGRGSSRNRHIMGINSWLRGWCRHEGFGVYDNGTFFNDYNLLERDGTHLSRRGKGIFATFIGGL